MLRAVVAQAVEHFLGKEEVPGSSPGNSSIKIIGNTRSQPFSFSGRF